LCSTWVTICCAWETCHSTRHTSITTLQPPVSIKSNVIERYCCTLPNYLNSVKARLWTPLQLFLGACIVNNVAWEYVSYNNQRPYELAGGVFVCVCMVRGFMRCPEMRGTGSASPT
jgi:hypothetical protein